jgi:hypothetical protein
MPKLYSDSRFEGIFEDVDRDDCIRNGVSNIDENIKKMIMAKEP